MDMKERTPTKVLVEPLVVARIGPKRRKVKHNGPLAPVGAVRRVVRPLTEQVKVGLADCPPMSTPPPSSLKHQKLTLDINPTPIRRRHHHPPPQLLIKQPPHPLQHAIRHRRRKRQLQRQPMQPVLPLRPLVGIQTPNKHIIVPAIHGPRIDVLVGALVAEVGLGPEAEEDFLGEHVGRGQVLAAVEEGAGGDGFEGGDGEGVLEGFLGGRVGWDGVVVAVVEFAFVGPPLEMALECLLRKGVSQSILTHRFAVAYGAIMP